MVGGDVTTGGDVLGFPSRGTLLATLWTLRVWVLAVTPGLASGRGARCMRGGACVSGAARSGTVLGRGMGVAMTTGDDRYDSALAIPPISRRWILVEPG